MFKIYLKIAWRNLLKNKGYTAINIGVLADLSAGLASFILNMIYANYERSKWLESFAYKTPISWWIFALSGVTANFERSIVVQKNLNIIKKWEQY